VHHAEQSSEVQCSEVKCIVMRNALVLKSFSIIIATTVLHSSGYKQQRFSITNIYHTVEHVRHRVVLTGRVVHVRNCSLHWLTLELLMHITMVDRFIVEAAVTPVSDFPAPHGNTIIPDRALPLPNILDSDLS
jgi:hypothetical protein